MRSVILLIAMMWIPMLALPQGVSREDRLRQARERVSRMQQEQAAQATPAPDAAAATPAPQADEGDKEAPAVITPVPQAPALPGQPAPPPQGPVQPVQATPAPAPTAAPAGTPGGPRSESKALLYFRPYDSVANLGDTFETQVIADTRETQADSIAFTIVYPPDHLNPLAIDTTPLGDDLAVPATIDYDAAGARLYVRLQLTAPRKLTAAPVARVYWEALAPTSGIDLRIDLPQRPATGLFLKGENVLGTGSGAPDGVINASVLIRNPRARQTVRAMGERGLIIGSSTDLPPPPRMRLRLRTPETVVAAGETFDVDLLLENPERDPFDRIKVYVQFDPARLQVVDSDSGNIIRRGINIHDGFARDQFPFDFFRTNRADNETGEIMYEVASELAPIRESGTFARIRLRALQPIERTDLVLVSNEPGEIPTSDVMFLQQSTMRSPPARLAPLDGIAFRVTQPRTASRR